MRMVREERRDVRWIKKTFSHRIEGLRSLALLAKESDDRCTGIL